MNRLLGSARMADLFLGPRVEDCLPENWDETLDRMELRFTLRNDASLIYPLVRYLRGR